MHVSEAMRAFDAFSGELRMNIILLLANAGELGMASGAMAEELGVPANSLSTQLGLLQTAGLVEKRREGRSAIYNLNLSTMKRLIRFIANDCAAGGFKIKI